MRTSITRVGADTYKFTVMSIVGEGLAPPAAYPIHTTQTRSR